MTTFQPVLLLWMLVMCILLGIAVAAAISEGRTLKQHFAAMLITTAVAFPLVVVLAYGLGLHALIVEGILP